jgi:tetratricopeptide (TPR) repeat protein
MARLAVIVSVITLSLVLVGCNGKDAGKSQMLSPQGDTTVSLPTVDVSKTGEKDLAAQMAVSRQEYRRGLELLVDYYTKTGNNMKLTWAKKELNALNSMPQYDYIIEATMAGPGLKPTKSLSDADALYAEAVRIEEQASPLKVVKDESLLRMALEKYNQLISKYPNSDKIDDAAFRAAGIYEYLKDYTIAVQYYQRTYQWNPQTPTPARFKAAYLLDTQLGRRAEALQLYQDALSKITKSDEHRQWVTLAERRVKELSGEANPKP